MRFLAGHRFGRSVARHRSASPAPAVSSGPEPEAGPRARCWLREEDFAHDGHGLRIADELELEVYLSDLTKAEQARMVTCLAPQAGEGVAKIRLKATIHSSGRVQTQWFGGDSQQADVERHARDAVRFVYLHPLRDAASDLRPGRDNKLISLTSALAPEGHGDRDMIVQAAQVANDARAFPRRARRDSNSRPSVP